MDDAELLPGVFERGADGLEDDEDVADGHLALAAEVAGEGVALDKLHDEVVDALLLADIVDADDVAVAEARGGFGLVDEAVDVLGGAHKVGVEDLDGDLAARGELARAVDDGG